MPEQKLLPGTAGVVVLAVVVPAAVAESGWCVVTPAGGLVTGGGDGKSREYV